VTFVRLEALPITANGKLDRTNLPAPSAANIIPDDRSTSRGCHAVTTIVETDVSKGSLESQLVKLWEAILSIRSIGIDDDSFELGGDSLLAARLFARIEATLNVTLPLVTL